MSYHNQLINAIYFCPHLFANFAARLPEPTRPEIEEILQTYDMEEYDAFELLKRSGAKLPTDNYEFVRKWKLKVWKNGQNLLTFGIKS